MTPRRLNHVERERMVLDDLKMSFPESPLSKLVWVSLTEGDDPPDFIANESNGRLGLELVEWLDGDQMRAAKNREKQRDEIQRILRTGWERFHPEHFIRAFVSPSANNVRKRDELSLRAEFYECAAEVDQNWAAYAEGSDHFFQTRFERYPRVRKYISSVRYIEGTNEGICWIGLPSEGGAFDPLQAVEVLKGRLDDKLVDYSSPKKRAHLQGHALSKLFLLIHGGFNAFAYNTPSGPSLDRVAALIANYCGQHPNRNLCDEVWFFNSLSSSEEAYLNPSSSHGRWRFLAQLWPQMVVVSS
jgi:hypothetical protein